MTTSTPEPVMYRRPVVGLRFQQAGRLQYYDPAGLELVVGDMVIVQTKHGLRIGKVAVAPAQVVSSDVGELQTGILRKATAEDLDQSKAAINKGHEAFSICKELVTKHGLDMKILDTESNLSGDHIIVYFTAPAKVDFRKLARDMAQRLKAKIEIRQVGPRDAAKIVGGLGRCGAPLCCATFLTEFNPVSVKMAKDQNVSLDPMKNSGACGRLLCCLGYEAGHYREIVKKLPKQNSRVQTPQGPGKVVGLNVLRETVSVLLENQSIIEVSPTDLTPQV